MAASISVQYLKKAVERNILEGIIDLEHVITSFA